MAAGSSVLAATPLHRLSACGRLQIALLLLNPYSIIRLVKVNEINKQYTNIALTCNENSGERPLSSRKVIND